MCGWKSTTCSLAEHAEVTGAKLYLMGGGWDTMNVAEAPANVRVNARRRCACGMGRDERAGAARRARG